ncbi:MAG: DUF2867 domain-containing protein [Trueperaceae bacterium]|nr:MAG: DUF2867 domain-containing protein [Trueperaceae bacterium]
MWFLHRQRAVRGRSVKVLVTGATGYIGGRLIPRLLAARHQVRVLVRDPGRVRGRPWIDGVEVAVGDLLAPDSLASALEGVDAAYYLVHSMYGGADFAAQDRLAAQHFVEAAQGLAHVIYLGGLVPQTDDLSAHLSSRAEVGRILREGLPTTEFQAGPIIGSGSASFEMVRYLTERLPAMIAPKWILNDVQPVAVRDVLAYLVSALDKGPSGVVEIGADRLSFKEMMLGYARVRGLSRLIQPVPVLAPALAARWVGLVTPIPNTLAVPLVEGVVHPVVADTERAQELFPEIDPTPYEKAVELALKRIEEGVVETRWSGSLANGRSFRLEDREGLIREVQAVAVAASREQVFQAFTSLGGDRGWLVWDWAWRLRGLLDKLIGGPGLRRGRRHPSELLAGEALDFWRVEEVVAPTVLRLRAEMRVPGRAWLQFEAVEQEGKTNLIQTALFEPKGLAGVLYWYGLYPLHRLIFRDMVRAVARRAEGL